MTTTYMEEELCPVCRGSGEGLTGRSTCYNCNGTGVVWVEVKDEQDKGEDDGE